MEEIKVEDFVRLKGVIAKLISICGKYYYFDKKIDYREYVPKRNSLSEYMIKKTKHSSNIIDLIEVGDYVNGKRIHKIDKGENYCYLYYGNCKTFVDYQIKTILTKEQMEANQYVVK